jgi:ankyrin repeat protein
MKFLSNIFPEEIVDQILLYLSTDDILKLGKENVSEYVWLRKKDKTIIQAYKNKNPIGIKYHLSHSISTDLDDKEVFEFAMCEEHIHPDGKTRIICADHYERLDLVKILLEHHPLYSKNGFLTSTNLYNYSPFIKAFPKEGISIFYKDTYKLIESIINNDIKNVKYLVEEQVVDVYAYNRTIFMIAVQNRSLEIIRYLFTNDTVRKESADYISSINYTLLKSAEYGYLDIVKFLLEQGADIHLNLNNPLSWSAVNNYPEIVNLLLLNGADANFRGSESLFYIVMYGQNENLKLLIEYGIDMRIYDDELMITAMIGNKFETAKLLIKAGVTMQDDYRRPFHKCVEFDQLDIFKLLIEYSIDIKHTYMHIFHWSIDNNYPKVTKYLNHWFKSVINN